MEEEERKREVVAGGGCFRKVNQRLRVQKERINEVTGLGWCVGIRELRETWRGRGRGSGHRRLGECNEEEEPQEWRFGSIVEAR